jgi:hypothetical protein
LWFGVRDPGEDGDAAGFCQLFTAQPDSFSEESFQARPPVGRSVPPGEKNTVPEMIGRLPDERKKIGRKSAAFLKQVGYFHPAFETQRTWQIIFSDQLLPPTVFSPWSVAEPESCGRPWSTSGRESRGRSASCDSKVGMSVSLQITHYKVSRGI